MEASIDEATAGAASAGRRTIGPPVLHAAPGAMPPNGGDMRSAGHWAVE